MSPYIIPGLKFKEPDRGKRVINVIMDYFNESDFNKYGSKYRGRDRVYKRQLMMYFLRRNTKLPITRIGEMFNRDHTTVVHATKTINDLMFSDEIVLNDVIRIGDKLDKVCIRITD